MGSSRRICEIVEVEDEPSTIRPSHTLRHIRAQDREQRSSFLKKGQNKCSEDDINKLFEAVNLRTSKSLDLSDLPRNASKKPIRAAGCHSPGIGFSEPVSLKQALRGLCISQAAEMAASKRASLALSSPRISEAGKITNLYRSVVAAARGSGCSPAEDGERRTEIALRDKESTSYSSEPLTQNHQDSVKKSPAQGSLSSPSFSVKPSVSSQECTSSEYGCVLTQNNGFTGGISIAERETTTFDASKLPQHLQMPKKEPSKQTAHSSSYSPATAVIKESGSSRVHNDHLPASEVVEQLLETGWSHEKKRTLVSPQPHHSAHNDVSKTDRKKCGSNKVASGPSNTSATSMRGLNNAAPKLRRKYRLRTLPSSSAVKSNKDMKSTRSISRAVKPVIRKKNLVLKKSKKVAASPDGNSKTYYEANRDLNHSYGHLICQRCQCSLEDNVGDLYGHPSETTSGQVFSNSGKSDARKSDSVPKGWENQGTSVAKTITMAKSSEIRDISQTSKSSICDFSSSTTSLSEDSNLSGPTSCNKPHGSKDVRWEAISDIRKQYGFLGLRHFNLLKKLGSGDIGTVYLAELIGTNCPFAIKVMDNEFLARRKKMPRAQTEREILRILDHPFLPTLYAQFTSDNLSCLVMEFCPGGDLHVLRQKQPGRYFPEQAARFYVAEVLLALEYLHMLGIVYRDLKPENILVREDGHIMLTDFDLSLRCSVNPTLIKSSAMVIEPARVSGPCAGSNCIDPFCTGPSCKVSCFSPRFLPATARARKLKSEAAAQARSLLQLVAEPTEARSNSFVGTHEYLAPEIINGEGHGSAVDWWTFGVFLYELLYGKTPFKGAGNEETLTNVVCQSLKFPDTQIVSFQARDLIRGLLVKEPENRLGTKTGAAEIKRHPFFEGLNWALIRCAVPPEIPELYDVRSSQIESHEKGKMHMECSANGEHLEFELF